MNFSITLFLSILAASVRASSSSSSDYESSSCDISSSSSSSSCSYSDSYFSSDSSPRLCAKELALIEEQPCLPVVNYMKKLEAEVKANIKNWLSASNRIETVVAFCNKNGIMVSLINPMGYGVMFPNPIGTSPYMDVSYMRAMALNKGVYEAGSGPYVRYSFPLRDLDGGYMMVQFMVPRSQLPLNNIKYKRNSLCN